MKNQNFYMRVISILLVIMAVFFYNSSMKAKENEKEIAALTDKVDTLQEQQSELLSALETIYTSRVQNQISIRSRYCGRQRYNRQCISRQQRSR